MRTQLTKAMRRAGVMLSGWLVASACSTTDVTAPQAPAEVAAPNAALYAPLADAIKSYLSATVLERVIEVPSAISVTQKVGSQGGKIVIPQTGFELEIPKGAVKSEVTFTVTAIPGKAVAYEFQPHGMKFRKPLKFKQHFLNTQGWWLTLGGGYFKNAQQINHESGTAKLDEEMPAVLDEEGWITFDIWHFSGYLVSCA